MTTNCYGMLALIDHQVGRMLSALQDQGVADNTIVVYTSDHGDLLGDHGLYLKGPPPYEGLLNVGAVVRGPGVLAGKVVDQPVSDPRSCRDLHRARRHHAAGRRAEPEPVAADHP